MPSVLVISNNCFSKSDSNGRTLANLFVGWPKENLAQFYIQNTEPEFDYCEQYYRLTDRQALASLYGKRPDGVISLGHVMNQSHESTPAQRRKRNALSMIVRDFVWSSGHWKTRYFNEWLSEIQPDIVVLQAGDCPFMFYLAVDIKRQYNAKLLIYNTEGYYFKDFDYFRAKGIAQIFYPLFHRRLKRAVNKAYNCCDFAVFNCEELESDYKRVFTIQSKVIFNATSLHPCHNPWKKETDSFTTIYAGNLGVGRAESLVLVANALHSISKEYSIQVYGKLPNDKIADLFSNCEGIDFRGFVSYDKLISIQQEADLLLHVESFDSFHRKDSKYAFSTKIADSLALGTCFLVFAPSEFASSRYLIQNHAAHVVTEQVALEGTLRKIINDLEYRNKFSLNALDLVERNHQQEKNAKSFQLILDSLFQEQI